MPKLIPSPKILVFILLPVTAVITGLLLSLVVGWAFPDAAGKFTVIAIVNSVVLGFVMLLSLYITRSLVGRYQIIYIILLSFCLVLGTGILVSIIIFILEPVVFLYSYKELVSFLFINLISILSLNTIVTGAVLYQETISAKEKALSDEKVMKKEIEMKLLSAKLNPHFLFNSLNLIVSLLRIPEKAETALINLSELLRYNLDNSDKDRVSLKDELSSVEKYLHIQEMRFEGRLKFEINCDIQGEIPPLTLQPLVENSIKYNINETDMLEIKIDAIQVDNRLVISIVDSARKVNSDMLNRGTGLTVTGKRVENAGGKLTIKDGGIEISLII